MIFFDAFGASSGFPAWATANSFVYSFIYQCTYIPADALIATGVMIALCKSGAFDQLIKIMNPKTKENN